MPDEQWLPLVTQGMQDGCFGSDAMFMLRLEVELAQSDIEVVFEPRRPGEDFWTKAAPQPISLMVASKDLPRAREIADGLRSAIASESTEPDDPDESYDSEADDISILERTPEGRRQLASPPQPNGAIHPGCVIVMLGMAVCALFLSAY